MNGTFSFVLPLHVLGHRAEAIQDAADDPSGQLALMQTMVGSIFDGTALTQLVEFATDQAVAQMVLSGGVVHLGQMVTGFVRGGSGIKVELKAEIDPASGGSADLQFVGSVILSEMLRAADVPVWFPQMPVQIDVQVSDPDRQLPTCSVRNDDWYLLCQNAGTNVGTKRIQVGASGDTYDDEDPSWGQVSRVLFSFLEGTLSVEDARKFLAL